MREILKRLKDGTEAALINFDQSKALIGLTIGSWRLFWSRRIPIGVAQTDYHDVPQPTGDGVGEQKKRSEAFAIGPASSGVARARAPIGAKFVGIQAKVDILASKVIVFKGQSKVVHRVRLPLDPLPLVCTSSA